MASAASRRRFGTFGRFGLWVVRLAVVLALVVAWTALELRAVRERTAANLTDAATIAKGTITSLLGHVARVGGAFDAADLASHDRIALTARLLRLDPLVHPARGLFLYDASGRFVAATEPFSPEGGNVASHFWFQYAVAQPTNPAAVVSNLTTAPLSGAPGLLITRTLADANGKPAGVLGTWLSRAAIGSLLAPPILNRPAEIDLARAGAAAPLFFLDHPAPAPPPHDKLLGRRLVSRGLHRLLGLWGEPAIVTVQTRLPGGLVWRARSDIIKGITRQERETMLWHGGLLALGALLLALIIRRPLRRRPDAITNDNAGPPALAPELDVEWIWEIDQRGLLVGVAGNAPESLVAAVGADFLAMADGDSCAEVLRAALVGREAIANLDLALTLPSSAGGARRRFRLNGRPVAETGGMWGSAREILSEREADRQDMPPLSASLVKLAG